MDNTLSLLDQGSFLWVQASGHVHCVQGTWVYRRDIDLDGLRHTQRNLAHGLLGRRVECSPLPFGRHRWVAWHEPPDIDIAPPASGPTALGEWMEERAQVRIDPQRGPSWHIGVLPITGMGAAVSLVASHTVIDGIGLCLALADAARGTTADPGYPAPGSHSRGRALIEDARITARGITALGRAVVAGLRVARQSKVTPIGTTAQPPGFPGSPADIPIAVPGVTVAVDQDEWDVRAQSLGGTPGSLFGGFATKLAERVGRVQPGGRGVVLTYPVSDRTAGDTRGNALRSVDVVVDPTSVAHDLRALRGSVRAALAVGAANFTDQRNALPLIPLVPKVLARKLAADAVAATAYPVGCSYLGDIDPAVARVDGAAADGCWIRLVAQNLTSNSPEIKNGELHITGGRICGKLFLAVRCYQPGAADWQRKLREHVCRTLADFNLAGDII